MQKIALILGLLFLANSASASPDHELVRLRTAFAAADTQAELNVCSAEIAQHLDRKVAALEKRIESDLDAAARVLFTAAAEKWRDYRSAQTKSEGDIYRGGSIQPLIHNRVFSRITEERLAALQDWNPEGKYRED